MFLPAWLLNKKIKYLIFSSFAVSTFSVIANVVVLEHQKHYIQSGAKTAFSPISNLASSFNWSQIISPISSAKTSISSFFSENVTMPKISFGDWSNFQNKTGEEITKLTGPIISFVEPAFTELKNALNKLSQHLTALKGLVNFQAFVNFFSEPFKILSGTTIAIVKFFQGEFITNTIKSFIESITKIPVFFSDAKEQISEWWKKIFAFSKTQISSLISFYKTVAQNFATDFLNFQKTLSNSSLSFSGVYDTLSAQTNASWKKVGSFFWDRRATLQEDYKKITEFTKVINEHERFEADAFADLPTNLLTNFFKDPDKLVTKINNIIEFAKENKGQQQQPKTESESTSDTTTSPKTSLKIPEFVKNSNAKLTKEDVKKILDSEEEDVRKVIKKIIVQKTVQAVNQKVKSTVTNAFSGLFNLFKSTPASNQK